MTSDNVNIILTNAICCSAKKALELSDLLSKNSLCVDSKIKELKVLNDSIDIARCYNIKPSNSIFTLRFLYTNYVTFTTSITESIKNYTLYVNNLPYSNIGNNITTKYNMFIQLLDVALPGNYTVSVSIDSQTDIKITKYATITVTSSCNIFALSEKANVISTGVLSSNMVFNSQNVGNCLPLNCLKEEEFNKLIANIMNICDICDCQLKNTLILNQNPIIIPTINPIIIPIINTNETVITKN